MPTTKTPNNRTPPPEGRKPTQDELDGMTWFNSLSEQERAYWLAQADTAIAAQAWAQFKKKSS